MFLLLFVVVLGFKINNYTNYFGHKETISTKSLKLNTQPLATEASIIACSLLKLLS